MEYPWGEMPVTLSQLAQTWYWIVTAMIFVFGACIGSFLNVCIYRIPRDIKLGKPHRSFCPDCRHKIEWYDNVPLLSWLFLGGKCRHCSARITSRYFVVELLVAVLFVLGWFQWQIAEDHHVWGIVAHADWRVVPVAWLVVSGLVVAMFVDFEHYIIPDRVSLGGIVAGLLCSAAVPGLHGETSLAGGVMWSAIGVVAGSGSLWLIAKIGEWVFKKEAMGLGDVKLLGAIGAFMGPVAVLFTVLISSLLGAIVGVTLVALGRRELQGRIPFGPYLALAALLWLFWGPAIWGMYLGLFLVSAA